MFRAVSEELLPPGMRLEWALIDSCGRSQDLLERLSKGDPLVTQSRLRNLVERFDGFSYGYRMNCECGRAMSLSAADYFAEANRAHINCEHCGRSIHFGPLVAALRDEHDPALDGNTVGQLAWYHTSTWSDWPSPAYVSRTEPSMREAFERFDLGRAHDLAQHTTKALHLGRGAVLPPQRLTCSDPRPPRCHEQLATHFREPRPPNVCRPLPPHGDAAGTLSKRHSSVDGAGVAQQKHP
jgi:hypothetical protein